MTALDLSALEALEREATPAPWRWDIDSDKSWEADMGSIAASGVTVMWFGDAETYYPTCGSPPNDADRDFLLALRNSFPALAAELRAAREDNARLRLDLAEARGRLGEQVRANLSMPDGRRHEISQIIEAQLIHRAPFREIMGLALDTALSKAHREGFRLLERGLLTLTVPLTPATGANGYPAGARSSLKDPE